MIVCGNVEFLIYNKLMWQNVIGGCKSLLLGLIRMKFTLLYKTLRLKISDVLLLYWRV
jgi:hypothetical protein